MTTAAPTRSTCCDRSARCSPSSSIACTLERSARRTRCCRASITKRCCTSGVPPHAAVYVQEPRPATCTNWCSSRPRSASRSTPSRRGASTRPSRTRPRSRRMLARRLPDYRVRVTGPSWWRGDRRVANACRAQVVAARRAARHGHRRGQGRHRPALQTVGSLMEKQSRVASWGVRTVTGPLLAAAGVVTLRRCSASFDAALGEAGRDGAALRSWWRVLGACSCTTA